ncbi:MAG: thiosulfate oxidation carrier protein SoxY, partial [Gemmatimonadota bacterium]
MISARLFSRRSFLRRVTLAVAGLAGVSVLGRPRARAAAATTSGDEPSEQVKKVLRELFGDRPIRAGHVQLDVPEEAPDGRVVPVFVESDLPMTPADHVKAIHLLVDKNPDIHVASFELTPALGRAAIDTRIKMRATSPVRAIVETSGGDVWWSVKKVLR